MSQHWYDPLTAEPRHFVPCKTKAGDRPSTIADARKNAWVPGVSTVLSVLARPALTEWIRREVAMACVTTPQKPNETVDEYVERVLRVDAESDARRGRDLGTAIHDAIGAMLAGRPYDPALQPYVQPIPDLLAPLGKPVWSERVLVCDEYGGRADLLLYDEANQRLNLPDFKTSKRVAEKVYPEHAMQLSAYARMVWDDPLIHGGAFTAERLPISCWIVSISTTEPGKVALLESPGWLKTYNEGFVPALRLWQHLNAFGPGTNARTAQAPGTTEGTGALNV